MAHYKPRVKIDQELIELAIADIKNSGRQPTAKEVARITGYTTTQIYLNAGPELSKQKRKKYITKKDKGTSTVSKPTPKAVEKFGREKAKQVIASLETVLEEVKQQYESKPLSDENIASDFLSKYFDKPMTLCELIDEEMELITELNKHFEETPAYERYSEVAAKIKSAYTVDCRRVVNKLIADKVLKSDANGMIVKVEATKPRLITPVPNRRANIDHQVEAVEVETPGPSTRKKFIVLNTHTGEHKIVFMDCLDDEIDSMLNNTDHEVEIYELKEVARAERKILRTQV